MKFKQWVICFLVTVLLASFSSAVIGQNASSSREDQGTLENKAKKNKNIQVMINYLMRNISLPRTVRMTVDVDPQNFY